MTAIQVGDVCLDLAQGRPVHVVEQFDGDAAAWSDANGYELTDNYGNSRLGATADDAVFEVVFCSSAKSQPSKTYAMPASRLLRVETEAADDGRPVRERIVRDVLADLFIEMQRSPSDYQKVVNVAYDITDEDVVEVARELADVEQTITTEGSDD